MARTNYLLRGGDRVACAVASATVIDTDDFVFIDNDGQVKVVAGTTHRADGIAITSSANGETADVTVEVFDGKKEFMCELGAAATVYAGALLQYTSDKKVVQVTSSEDGCQAFLRCADTVTSGTAIRCVGIQRNENPLDVDWCRKALGGSGTTTVVTWATEGLDDMADTSYAVFVSPEASTTIYPFVSTRAAATCTITHDSGSTVNVSLLRIGIRKRD